MPRPGHPGSKPNKADRWVIGLLAGAVVMYLLGRSLGLGKKERASD